MKNIEVYNKKKGLENEDINLEMSAFDDLVSVAWVAQLCALPSHSYNVLVFNVLFAFSMKTDSEFTKLMNEVLLPMFDGEEKTQTQPVGDAVKFEYSPASGDVQDQV